MECRTSKAIIISPETKEKLKIKHSVSPRHVEQCFENREGMFLIDDREDHRTDPPSMWFIAQDNEGRTLKVVFIFEHGNIYIKTAYSPSPEVISLYERKAKYKE